MLGGRVPRSESNSSVPYASHHDSAPLVESAIHAIVVAPLQAPLPESAVDAAGLAPLAESAVHAPGSTREDHGQRAESDSRVATGLQRELAPLPESVVHTGDLAPLVESAKRSSRTKTPATAGASLPRIARSRASTVASHGATPLSAARSSRTLPRMLASTPPVARLPRLPSTEMIREQLEDALRTHEHVRDLRLTLALAECGYRDQPSINESPDGIDKRRVAQLTALARRPGSTLGDLVKLVRGETDADPRPNKALRPADLRWLLTGYEHASFVALAAAEGIRPTWLRSRPAQEQRPKNHQSAVRFAHALAKSVRTGQDAGQYLVVDGSILDLWPDIQISPLGAVEKTGVDPMIEIRLIHDLKRPIGSSTNEATNRSDLPRLTYVPVSVLCRRIDELYAKDPTLAIYIMKGDVKGAFRHLMVHWSSVQWMGALIESGRKLIIDLSAPFGWTSSPTYYGAFGGAISWLVRRESPASLDLTQSDTEPFFAYEWVDDHVLIEHAVGDRLTLAAAALRTSMMAVLGPRSLNEKKFSSWETRLEVLGLEFDLEHRTVSMPQRKIDKACRRLRILLQCTRATRQQLSQLLGSLRHVCTCCRAVKPFFQRVQALASAAPPFGTTVLTAAVQQDLRWCLDLLELGQFRALPTTMFGEWPTPDIHLYMDASNSGLAVLDPALQRYIQIQFDESELTLISNLSPDNGFTINVREQLSVALAVSTWGSQWRERFASSIGQVWCWIDNTTAVATTNKLASRNAFAQELNRRIGFCEAVYGFRVRCLHLPGRLNKMADAGMVSDRRGTDREEALRTLLRELQHHGMAPRTLQRYESVWNHWVAWCLQFDWSPWLPRDQSVHSNQLALFATYCWADPPVGLGNAHRTVLSKISAISWRHRRDCGYPVGIHDGHALAVQGMRRLSSAPRAMAPATKPLLHAFRSRCSLAEAHDRVLWGAALVGFFFLLRCSEYLQVNGTVEATVLTYADVTLRDDRGVQVDEDSKVSTVELRLRGSKTDQEGNSVVLPLGRSGSGWFCPVLAVLDLVRHGKRAGLSANSPLCSVDSKHVVKASAMIAKLRQAAGDCNIDPSRIATHSLRSGGATALMAAGVDQQLLKLFGRWKSDRSTATPV